jgi:hypothetical protein
MNDELGRFSQGDSVFVLAQGDGGLISLVDTQKDNMPPFWLASFLLQPMVGDKGKPAGKAVMNPDDL